jgi:hypothetical protein
MLVGDKVKIGDRTFEVDVIMPIERQVLLTYKTLVAEMTFDYVYGWVSFDDLTST